MKPLESWLQSITLDNIRCHKIVITCWLLIDGVMVFDSVCGSLIDLKSNVIFF